MSKYQMTDAEADHFYNGTLALMDNLGRDYSDHTARLYTFLARFTGKHYTPEEIRTINRFCFDATMYIQRPEEQGDN